MQPILEKHCGKCGHQFPLSYFQMDENVCANCLRDVPHAMSPGRSLSAAANALSKELNRSAKTDAIPHSPVIWDGVISKLAEEAAEGETGQEVLGRLIGALALQAFGSKLDDAEKKARGWTANVRARFAGDLMKHASRRDEVVGKPDLSAMSEEDLMQGMMSAAAKLIAENSTFRREVIYRELRLNLTFRAEVENMLRMLTATAVTANGDEPDYTEYTG